MASRKRLIVGLGNPGDEYAGTRHNVGFMVVDALAERLRIDLEHGGQALVGWGRHKGYPVGLAKPLTYMNRSGDAVAPLVREHDLDASEVLVIVDDVHLPPGKLRMRPSGSSGGHNGVEHVTERLGTDGFPRLRIGIGDDYGRGQQADYVLSPFSAQQKPVIEDALISASNAVLTYVRDGVDAAMNRFN
jgi:PTH1 family peptidyl-tRNA hydrolase